MISWNITNYQRLQELCDDIEVILDFLSSYSSDFNSIEKTFMKLKVWMRKNNQLQDVYANFEGSLKVGLMYMSNKTGNHFKSCHILVSNHSNIEI